MQSFKGSSWDSNFFAGVFSSPITLHFSPVLTVSDAVESSRSEDLKFFFRSQLSLHTFNLVADNLDFYIRPR